MNGRRPIVTVTVALVLFEFLSLSLSDLREYCFPNSFNVTCAKDEVIVMTKARYGRISKGLCMTSDYHVGCWADVLYYVDRKCSGRHSCIIAIPDTVMHNIQPCPKDMLSYLESDYLCQKVQTRSSFPCKHLGELVVTDELGYLSSIITEEHGFGTSRCPWVISIAKGRKVNITLIDFAIATRYPEVRNTCHVYAKIRETGVSSDVTICGGNTRERVVYVSEGSRVEVTVVTLKVKNEPIHFLLKYEAIGCTDPRVPKGAWLKRDGVQAAISCNYTSQTWHIVCQADSWFGVVDNCTIESMAAKSINISTEISEMYPLGLLIAVMVGLILGVLIGVILLTFVISCHKRFRRNKSMPQCVIYGTPHSEEVLEESPYCSASVRSRCADHDGYRYTHVCGASSDVGCPHQTSPG